MRSVLSVLPLAMLLFGCQQGYHTVVKHHNEVDPTPGSIRGRVCDPSGRTWLPDAEAYTNVFDTATGKIVDTRTAFSDRDGWWTLDNLDPGNYTVYVQYGQTVLDTEVVAVEDGQETDLDEPDCFDPTAINIAVVTGDYDDVQLVLDSLGFTTYTLVDGTDQDALTGFLSSADTLAEYDMIFMNGGVVEKGVIYDPNPADTVPDTVIKNLQDFVENGGAFYATDWSYDFIEKSWPDAIDFMGDDNTEDAAQLGEYDEVTAMITDESLSAFLGDSTTTDIKYDLPVWPPMTGVEPYVSIHLTGTVHYTEGQSTYTLASAPLLASFSDGNGRVGYSTFRVAANQSENMTLILQYMMQKLN